MTEYLEKAETLTRAAVILYLAAGFFLLAVVWLGAGMMCRGGREREAEPEEDVNERGTMFLSDNMRGCSVSDGEDRLYDPPENIRQRGGDQDR